MRRPITYIFILLTCVLFGLLFPFVLHAQRVVEEPFVCAGVYNEDRLSAHKQAKIARARPSRLTALVIFAQFANEAPEDSLAPPYAEDLFDPDLPGSLSHFYHHMSFGQFEIEGTVLPKHYASLHEVSYYVPLDTSATGGYFDLFNREILQQADGEVDFGRFDNDGPDGIPNSGDDDGYVDFVFINLGSVVEEFFRRTATGIASLGLQEPYLTDDPSALGGFIQVRDGTTQRVWGFTNAPGVMAHELGHWLGLPDLYDTSPWKGIPPEEDSGGIGNWGLMGRGALGWYGNDGPVPFCAWSREQLGWIGEDNANLIIVDRPMQNIVIEDVEGGKVHKMPITEREYFLIEHRQRSGGYYDRNIPGKGLLIWHVGAGHDNEDERRKRVDLECADGRYADRGYPDGVVAAPDSGCDNLDFWAHDAAYRDAHRGNLGDATDVFDGILYTAFGPDSNPSSAAGNRTYTGHRVENIRREGERMIVDLIPGLGRLALFLGGVEDGGSEGTVGDEDGVMDPGEIVGLYVELGNQGLTAALGVQAVLRTEDPFVTIVDSTAEIGDLFPGERTAGAFRVVVSSEASAFGHGVAFTLQMRDAWGHRWEEAFTRRMGAGVALASYALLDRGTDSLGPEAVFGNGDGKPNPGELVGLSPVVRREGAGTFAPQWIELRSDDPFLRNPGGNAFDQRCDLVAYGSERYGLDDEYFRLLIAPETPDGYAMHLRVTIGSNNPEVEPYGEVIRLEIRGSDTTPPYVMWMENRPPAMRGFDVGDQVTVLCRFYGMEQPKHVQLMVVTVPDGQQVGLVELFDDGEHDDQWEDDGTYGVTWTIPIASDFQGSIVAEDAAGNRSETPLWWGWSSAPFEATSPVLLRDWVPPDGESVYVDALNAKGIPYDLQNAYYAGLRGLLEIPHYTVVIVTQKTGFGESLLGNYLDAGGHLLLVNMGVHSSISRSFSEKYLYSQTAGSYQQPVALEGVPGDPITDGLESVSLEQCWFSFRPIWPATSILNDASGTSYGIKVATDTYRAVVLGFDIGYIADTRTRRMLLHRIVEWLMSAVTSSDLQGVKEPTPTAYALHPNVPNPFNALTTIRYDVPVGSRIALCIYSISGQRICSLTSAPHQPGTYTVTWDATDEEGRTVGSGMYLYRLVGEGFRSTRKMVLMQ